MISFKKNNGEIIFQFTRNHLSMLHFILKGSLVVDLMIVSNTISEFIYIRFIIHF